MIGFCAEGKKIIIEVFIETQHLLKILMLTVSFITVDLFRISD